MTDAVADNEYHEYHWKHVLNTVIIYTMILLHLIIV